MNGKDMLSQEEIDALLRQNNPSDDLSTSESAINNESGLESYLSPFEQDALGEIGNISFGSAATALSMLLGQKVEITTPTVSLIKYERLNEEFPQPHVAVHVRYTDGFEGINLLVIKKQDAQIIADLMMGGNGTVLPEELNELHISAVQEAMNQMMGSSATSMSTIFNKMVNITPPGIDILDIANNQGTAQLPQEKVFVKVSFRLKVGHLIDSSIMQLLTVPFAKNMIDMLTADTRQEAAATSLTTGVSPTRTTSDPELISNNFEQPVQQKQQQHIQEPTKREVNVQPAQFAMFEPAKQTKEELANLGMLLDINLQLTVELGRTKKTIKEILDLSPGSIIELDKHAGEPVDILVNNKLIARGEVVVIEDNFGVRITDILSQWDRVQKLS